MALVAYNDEDGRVSGRTLCASTPPKGLNLQNNGSKKMEKKQREDKEGKGSKRRQKELKGAYEFRPLSLLLSGCSMLDPHAQACVLTGASTASVTRSLAR